MFNKENINLKWISWILEVIQIYDWVTSVNNQNVENVYC